MTYITGHVASNVAKWEQTFSTKEGQEYKNGCTDGLKMRDLNNNGKTSALEEANYTKSLYSSIFQNTKFESTANVLAQDAGSIFEQYAGDDGILSEAEYAAAINSEEYGAHLEQYWALLDEVENGGTEEKLKNNDADGTFESINGIKGVYIEEISNEVANATQFTVDSLNSGTMTESEANKLSDSVDEIRDTYAQQLVDYTFNETQAVLADNSLSNEEKSNKINEIKEKMENAKEQAVKEIKLQYAKEKIKQVLSELGNNIKKLFKSDSKENE